MPVMMGLKNSRTLLDLPLFLREDIYDRIFWNMTINIRVDHASHKDRVPKHWFFSDVYPSRKVPCPTLAIAQTNRMMRSEALLRFYKRANFALKGELTTLRRVLGTSEAVARDSVGKDILEMPEPEKLSEAHISIVRDVLKNVQRLVVDLSDLCLLGLDIKSWTWSTKLLEIFPTLKELCIEIEIDCCDCEYIPLTRKLNETFHKQQQQTGNDDSNLDLTLTDGEFLRELLRITPNDVHTRFSVDLFQGCTVVGITTFQLQLNQKPQFNLCEWFNYETCNENLIGLLHDYGLPDEAEKVRKMIDTNESTILIS